MDALPAWINRDVWAGFLAMRTKIKRPLTGRAVTMIVNRLQELKDKGHDPNACLDQSTLHCWQTVFPLRDEPIERIERKETASEYAERMAKERESQRGTKPTPEQAALLQAVRSGSIIKRVA